MHDGENDIANEHLTNAHDLPLQGGIVVSTPQMERESRISAGFIPVAFPIILGVKKRSCMICTTIKTMAI